MACSSTVAGYRTRDPKVAKLLAESGLTICETKGMFTMTANPAPQPRGTRTSKTS